MRRGVGLVEHREEAKNETNFCYENLEGRDQFEDLCVAGNLPVILN
jgi:hypothetical protein